MVLGELERSDGIEAITAIAGGPAIAAAAAANPPPDISSDAPDWSREKLATSAWSPASALLEAFRDHQRHVQARLPWSGLLRRIAVLRYRFWSAATGADIPLNCTIGGGLMLPHPNGIVIHPLAFIGVNCLLFQQVTIGMRRGGVPRIEGDVEIGAGAKILGAVTVGKHAKIGANAVVLTDVPEGAIAVGSPARIILRRPRDNFAALLQPSDVEAASFTATGRIDPRFDSGLIPL